MAVARAGGVSLGCWLVVEGLSWGIDEPGMKTKGALVESKLPGNVLDLWRKNQR